MAPPRASVVIVAIGGDPEHLVYYPDEAEPS